MSVDTCLIGRWRMPKRLKGPWIYETINFSFSRSASSFHHGRWAFSAPIIKYGSWQASKMLQDQRGRQGIRWAIGVAPCSMVMLCWSWEWGSVRWWEKNVGHGQSVHHRVMVFFNVTLRPHDRKIIICLILLCNHPLLVSRATNLLLVTRGPS